METVELGSDDAAELARLYREYGWWDDRDAAAVGTALSNTDLALDLRDGGNLVASARVITDFTYYARMYDVSSPRTGAARGSAVRSSRRSWTTTASVT